MAHCPFEQLDDLKQELNKIRDLPKVKEIKPGTFYLKSKGFLHFHINKEGQRWADVRNGSNWGSEIQIPPNSSKIFRNKFITEVQKRYQNTYKELYK